MRVQVKRGSYNPVCCIATASFIENSFWCFFLFVCLQVSYQILSLTREDDVQDIVRKKILAMQKHGPELYGSHCKNNATRKLWFELTLKWFSSG